MATYSKQKGIDNMETIAALVFYRKCIWYITAAIMLLILVGRITGEL